MSEFLIWIAFHIIPLNTCLSEYWKFAQYCMLHWPHRSHGCDPRSHSHFLADSAHQKKYCIGCVLRTEKKYQRIVNKYSWVNTETTLILTEMALTRRRMKIVHLVNALVKKKLLQIFQNFSKFQKLETPNRNHFTENHI